MRQQVFPSAQDQDHYYFASADGKMRQVANLQALKNVKQVILSLGWNELKTQENGEKDFSNDLFKCVEMVQGVVPADALVTLILPYHPHYQSNLEGWNVWGISSFLNIKQRMRLSKAITPSMKGLLQVAAELKCAVIDLSKTLDPKEVSHYGTGNQKRTNELKIPWTGEAPSGVAVKFMAELIRAVIQYSKQPQGKVFSGYPFQDIQVDTNDEDFRKNYVFGPQ